MNIIGLVPKNVAVFLQRNFVDTIPPHSARCQALNIVSQRRGLRLRESLRPPEVLVAGVAGGRGAEPLLEVPVEVHAVTLRAAVLPSVLPPHAVSGATVLVAVRIQNGD